MFLSEDHETGPHPRATRRPRDRTPVFPGALPLAEKTPLTAGCPSKNPLFCQFLSCKKHEIPATAAGGALFVPPCVPGTPGRCPKPFLKFICLFLSTYFPRKSTGGWGWNNDPERMPALCHETLGALDLCQRRSTKARWTLAKVDKEQDSSASSLQVRSDLNPHIRNRGVRSDNQLASMDIGTLNPQRFSDPAPSPCDPGRHLQECSGARAGKCSPECFLSAFGHLAPSASGGFGAPKVQKTLRKHSLGHSETGAPNRSKALRGALSGQGPRAPPVNGGRNRNHHPHSGKDRQG